MHNLLFNSFLFLFSSIVFIENRLLMKKCNRELEGEGRSSPSFSWQNEFECVSICVPKEFFIFLGYMFLDHIGSPFYNDGGSGITRRFLLQGFRISDILCVPIEFCHSLCGWWCKYCIIWISPEEAGQLASFLFCFLTISMVVC